MRLTANISRIWASLGNKGLADECANALFQETSTYACGALHAVFVPVARKTTMRIITNVAFRIILRVLCLMAIIIDLAGRRADNVPIDSYLILVVQTRRGTVTEMRVEDARDKGEVLGANTAMRTINRRLIYQATYEATDLRITNIH